MKQEKIDTEKLAEALRLLGLKAGLREKGTPDEFVLAKKDNMEWHIWNQCGCNMYSGEYNWETTFYYDDATVYDGLNHKDALDVVANIQDDIKQFMEYNPITLEA